MLSGESTKEVGLGASRPVEVPLGRPGDSLLVLADWWLRGPLPSSSPGPFHYLLALLPEDGESTCSRHIIRAALIPG